MVKAVGREAAVRFLEAELSKLEEQYRQRKRNVAESIHNRVCEVQAELQASSFDMILALELTLFELKQAALKHLAEKCEHAV